MPAKKYDPARPTFYLDQSTLSDAFRVHEPGQLKPADPAYQPLRGWVERVGHQANLCISTIHLLELAKWTASDVADALCRWLDGLPVVAVLGLHRVRRLEEEAWVRRAVRLPVAQVTPFATSMPEAFAEIPPELVAAVLQQPEPLTYTMNVMRNHGLHKRHKDVAPDFAAALRENRARKEFQHVTTERGRAMVAQNRRRDLARLASVTICSLRRDDGAFGVQSEPPAFAQKLALDLYDSDASLLPLFCIEAPYADGLTDGILRRQPGSAKDVAALSGAAEDGLHLVGAAYCDTFTCDQATSSALGDIRVKLGRTRQLAAGGYPGGLGAFVRDLMATWP